MSTSEIKSKCKENDEKIRSMLKGASKRSASPQTDLTRWRPPKTFRMELKWEEDSDHDNTHSSDSASKSNGSNSGMASTSKSSPISADAELHEEGKEVAQTEYFLELPELSVQMLEDLQLAYKGAVEEETAGKLELSTERPFQVSELTEALKPGPGLSSISSIIKPSMDAHTTPGTKKQKTLYMNYWGSFCAECNVDVANFGKMSKEESVEPSLRTNKVWEEVQCLAGFTSYVMLFPKRKTQADESTAHAEIAIGSVIGHYQEINKRIPGKDQIVDYGNFIKHVLNGLSKLYPSPSRKRLPLLSSHIPAIRGVMKL